MYILPENFYIRMYDMYIHMAGYLKLLKDEAADANTLD
jgi:hypothetical protein